MSNLTKSQLTFHPSSYTDTLGRVFTKDGHIYRAINSHSEKDCHELLRSDLFQELMEKGHLPATNVSDIKVEGYNLVLEHEKLLEIRPYEWSYTMCKDAALFLLEIQATCQKHGYALKDAHLNNILFRNSKPVYVDIGSFEKRKDSHWKPEKEFLICCYLPLKAWSRGDIFITRKLLETNHIYVQFLPKHDAFHSKGLRRYLKSVSWQVLYKHQDRATAIFSWMRYSFTLHGIVYFTNLILKKFKFSWGLLFYPRHSIAYLSNKIKKLNKRSSKTTWKNYHQISFVNNTEPDAYKRVNRIASIVSSLENVDSVVDLAGNEGLVAHLIKKECPTHNIIVTDYDENAIDSAYIQSRNNATGIHTVLSNFMIPVTNDVSERLRSDVALALAVTHHLVLTQAFDIDVVLNKIKSYSRKYVLVEFMPLGLWSKGSAYPAIPEWYNVEWFRAHVSKFFSILSEEKLEINRILFVLKVNNE